MLVFDAHLDLSLNAISYNRDLRLPLGDIRNEELGMTDLGGRARGTVCFPEMRKAGIGICVATQLAGCMKPAGPVGCWNSPEQAWAMTQGQLAWYRAMEEAKELRSIRTWPELSAHLEEWKAASDFAPIGYILSLEGADSIRTLDDVGQAYEQGLRALGPAHYGVGRYALGHDQSGPLSAKGRELLREMDRFGMILDATHLCDKTFWEALDLFQGPVWASHHNCRALVDDPRQLTDAQIQALGSRGSVIGIAFDIWMVVPNWIRKVTTHDSMPGANLSALANHVDHVCQLLGNANHVGIGSDLDGGYGSEQTPSDLNSIADLNRFKTILEERGYSSSDLESIFSGNFLRFVEEAWST